MNTDATPAMPYQHNDDPPAVLWRDPINALPWRETVADGVVLWYRKRGPCPRCLDEDGINSSILAEGYAGLGPEEETDIFVTCQCLADHARPKDVLSGCGWGGYVAGPVESRGQ